MLSDDSLRQDADNLKMEALERWIFQLEEQGLEPVFETSVDDASLCLHQMIGEVLSDEEKEEELLSLCDFCLVAWNLSAVKALDPTLYPDTLREIALSLDASDEMQQLLDELVSLKIELFPEQLYALQAESLQVDVHNGAIRSIRVLPEAMPDSEY